MTSNVLSQTDPELALVDKVSDTISQTGRAEGFGDHLDALVQMSMTDHRVLGIAGDEEHFEAWPKDAGGIGDLASVHPARQADVGDEEIDPSS